MKNITIKWVLFWVMGIITVLSAIGGSTGLQLLPLIGFIGLAYLDLKALRKVTIQILVLSVLMVIINITMTDPSWIDVIMWALVVLAWI